MCTLMRSGLGVSGGGSLAQLDTFSTGLNLRSDNGLCKPMVALGLLAVIVTGNEVLTHGQADELGTSTHQFLHLSS